MTGARVAIHGARAAIHDLHAGDGSFAAVAAALAVLRARRVEIHAWSAITRSSARSLAELPEWLHAHGVRSWALGWPRAIGEPFTRAIARIGLGMPHALAAVSRAGQL